MSTNTATKKTISVPSARDIRCPALVLRRVNYGEADRILDVLTPSGTVGLMAKGVRKEKSKLAGGIEPFCLTEITYHQRKTGGLGILTSAKMQKFYQNILHSLDKMEFASRVLKQVSRAAEHLEGSEFFQLTQPVLEALNGDTPQPLIETYFYLNFANIRGEAVNLLCDRSGAKLRPDQIYTWDHTELAFAPYATISATSSANTSVVNSTGISTAIIMAGSTSTSVATPTANSASAPVVTPILSPATTPAGAPIEYQATLYDANDIKYLRLMLSSSLALASRVKYPRERLMGLLQIAKSFNR